MPLRVIRNDITKMQVDAIVNTANSEPIVGEGCDIAIYTAAGYDELLAERKKIGLLEEGQVAVTDAFNLPSKYIFHAVSPLYIDGEQGEESRLRRCYAECLRLAGEYKISSIAFPLISSGSFGYPKEEALRIAVDEINSYLLSNELDVFLVLFDADSTHLGNKLYPDLEEYIDENYIENVQFVEYGARRGYTMSPRDVMLPEDAMPMRDAMLPRNAMPTQNAISMSSDESTTSFVEEYDEHVENLEERLCHLTDTFSEYLFFLIDKKGLNNADVYKGAIVDKKIFSKIKNNKDYHPKKITALCLCVGARCNLDETKDLLARAGYALSPCDMGDVIFSYFIENEIYDILEIDIQLEEHGLPCIIS